jgi:translation initiation factor 1 (eIF-1/SUI1)
MKTQQLRTENENTTMAQGETRKEQAVICKVSVEKEAADKRVTVVQEVSLSGDIYLHAFT